MAGVRVGLDLDGVCCDYVSYLREHLLAAGRAPASLPEPRDYQLSDWFPTAADRLAAHAAAVTAGLHRDAPPLPGASAGIATLHDWAASVVAVSARGSYGEDPHQIRRDFTAWAKRHGIAFDAIHLGRPKAAAGCHIYVDDSPNDITELRTAGQLAVVFDQPWNTGVDPPRATGWDDLPHQLLHLLDSRRSAP